MRRWEEIRIRQHRLMAEVEAQATPAHIDHIMKSGFTMSDIKGMSRNYEDGADVDDQMLRASPSRPPRKGSVTRGGYEDQGDMYQGTSSPLDMDQYLTAEDLGEDGKDDKKRGRSPFRFFKKNRDQSKDKLKSKSPEGRERQRMGRNKST